MNEAPAEIPTSTVILYMRVTGLTVGDQHWPVTGRGEFVYATPAMPLPAPQGAWRDLVADGHNVASTATFTFTPDADQSDITLAIEALGWHFYGGLLWAGGTTLSDGRPVTVMLTGYELDVCTPNEIRWHATRLPDDPVVVRFGVMS